MNRLDSFDSLYKRDMFDPRLQSRVKTALIGDTDDWEKVYVSIDYTKQDGMNVKYHGRLK